MSDIQTINPPQVVGLPLGASSEREGAMITQQNNANNLAALNNVTTGKVGGRRRMKRFWGGFATKSNDYNVSVIQPIYNDPMAGSQSATNQQVTNASTFNQSSANAVYDDKVAAPTPIPADQLKGGRGRKTRRIHPVRNYEYVMKPVLDRNHDGIVSKRELDYAIHTLLKANRKNKSSKRPSPYDERIMKDVIDTNYNGVVSKRELDNAIDILLKTNLKSKKSKYSSPYDKRIFKDVLDTNLDGVVSQKEINYAIRILKAHKKVGKTTRRKVGSFRKKSRKLRK
jgi:hypothetical protein